ncbi:PepSY domain-containing protein [Sphaerisporangium sp. NPDC005289]|uniref:PepSY domain-containing protein n=1 Tax=Sphaerisporangium sp. NPDC005289 TaxID=3155247 RepID=UPI0033B455C1
MRKSVIIAGLATAATLTAGGVAYAAQQDAFSPSPSASAPAVSREQAEKTALAKVPGGTVTSAELDAENGKQVWEFDIAATGGTEHDITVDATSGTVLADTQDDDVTGADGADDSDDD